MCIRDRGTALLDKTTAFLKDGDTLDGETAFKLYDTFGFPLDLTQDALKSKGIEVDTDGFDAAMARQKEESRTSGFKSGDTGTEDVWFTAKEAYGATEFVGYEDLSQGGKAHTVFANGGIVKSAADCDVMFVTKTTPFYAESGGQAGDKGRAIFPKGEVIISDVQKKAGDLHAVSYTHLTLPTIYSV